MQSVNGNNTHEATTYKIKQETSRPKTQTMTDSAHMFVVLMTHKFIHCILCGFITQSHRCHRTRDIFVLLNHLFTELSEVHLCLHGVSINSPKVRLSYLLLNTGNIIHSTILFTLCSKLNSKELHDPDSFFVVFADLWGRTEFPWLRSCHWNNT